MNDAVIVSQDCLIFRSKHLSFTFHTFTHLGDVIAAHYNIFVWSHHWISRSRFEQVMSRNHDLTSFSLSSFCQRNMHSHLVSIKVCIECSTNHWVKLNSFTF